MNTYLENGEGGIRRRIDNRPAARVPSATLDSGPIPGQSANRSRHNRHANTDPVAYGYAAIPYAIRPSSVSTARAPASVSNKSSGACPSSTVVGRRIHTPAFS
jgi:hypothetical protein